MNEAENDTPGLVRLSEGLGPPAGSSQWTSWVILKRLLLMRMWAA